jgi:hypothetical protein
MNANALAAVPARVRVRRRSNASFTMASMAVSIGLVAATAATVGGERVASADEVSPHGKGIVGGGLLGADVVTGTMGVIGVHNPWVYVIGGAVGAGGGAVGGYFVENASGDGRAPMYMLAGGLALIIPAVVLTLDATRFRPSDDATEDKAPTNGPPADPGKVGGSAVGGPATTPGTNGAVPSTDAPPPPGSTAPVATPPASGGSGGSGSPAPAPATPPPTSMFHFEGGQLRIGVPVPEVRPMYSAMEQKTYGVSGNATQVQMPMLRVRF